MPKTPTPQPHQFDPERSADRLIGKIDKRKPWRWPVLDRRFLSAFVQAGGATQPVHPSSSYRRPARLDVETRRTREVIVRRWRAAATAHGATPSIPPSW
ncbi:hypothetical protein ACFO1B_51855 [Dactylosporangium siamense]|uniref:Uncharacterized protein n=1 Tax=Dactylosporangium siamense TaxID=685454 RepID=A0A919PF56_9ACTN|nr:hypothetical protein [Dactylosporangium siamense]GIG43681.1 hypothetical protein Dsi01nite_017220 [Dactylosporangium siamense]